MTTPAARRPGTTEVVVGPERDGCTVVSLAGELEHGRQEPVWTRVEELVTTGHTHLVIDLSQVPFCDSTGLGLLVRLHRLTEAGGGWTRLAAPRRDLRRMLEITNLDRLLPVYDTLAEATRVA